MIEVKEIIKSYGNSDNKIQVLKRISLKIKDGDFAVILGASGSGKSTFLNVVSGLEYPDSGKVLYDGTDITTLSDKELTLFRKENVGFIFQQYYLLPNMSVDKNVKMGADLGRNKAYRNIIEAVGLGEKLHKYPSELSGGEQQMLAMGRALMSKPKIIVMDEPSMGLSPIFVSNIFDIIQTIRETGTTVLLVEQNAKKALSIADRAYVLETGKISLSGKASDLINDASVKKAYLGE